MRTFCIFARISSHYVTIGYIWAATLTGKRKDSTTNKIAIKYDNEKLWSTHEEYAPMQAAFGDCALLSRDDSAIREFDTCLSPETDEIANHK